MRSIPLVVAGAGGGLRLAATEAVAAVDTNRLLDPGEQLRRQQIADGRRVVDEDTVEAATSTIEVRVERHDRGEVLCPRSAERRDLGDVGRGHQDLLGHVEARHHDRAIGAEDDVGRFGVVEDVGLCRRRSVAAAERVAAHQHDPGQVRCEGRFDQHRNGDVGQRTEGDERDLTRRAHRRSDHEVSRVDRLWRCGGR